ncbi:hypothetical protein [Photobacterium galatheae]|uniref:Prolyl 4-hydroxylase alpha subunit Fe(2+) 2OG dioxygenase domain-containing protein n=1 Tax=Photobacterium galatheae TaxID=1654360 RepID=A0A066RKE6_9GAMM|nr:hypothetical protein [Photobacterium galatheae]KDM90925.1 hypothetical protein EA58_14290 [Photobacterium galatheae]MCM0149111.1 hypothetical protein [Photobacterium galatheae]
MKGGSSSTLPPHLILLLEAMTSQLHWYPDPEGIYKLIAEEFRPAEVLHSRFHKEKDHIQEAKHFNQLILESLNDQIMYALSQVLLSECFSEVSGQHDFVMKFADLWDGSEGCAWHSDAIEGGAFVVLIYLTDYDDWDDALGGQFEYGKVPYRDGDNCLIHYVDRADEIVSNGIVSPANGTMVVVNNHNHFMAHRCFQLTRPEEKRITITLGFDLKVKDDFQVQSKVLWPNHVAVS